MTSTILCGGKLCFASRRTFFLYTYIYMSHTHTHTHTSSHTHTHHLLDYSLRQGLPPGAPSSCIPLVPSRVLPPAILLQICVCVSIFLTSVHKICVLPPVMLVCHGVLARQLPRVLLVCGVLYPAAKRGRADKLRVHTILRRVNQHVLRVHASVLA